MNEWASLVHTVTYNMDTQTSYLSDFGDTKSTSESHSENLQSMKLRNA